MKPNKQTHSLTQKENKSPLPKRGFPSAPQRRQGVFQKRLAATETGHTYSLTHSLTHSLAPGMAKNCLRGSPGCLWMDELCRPNKCTVQLYCP
jgi:hypothetical protein